MAQKVKVASATFKKEGEGKFGKWYLYEIRLDGDDKVYQFMSKKNPQDRFSPGAEVDVEIETKQNGQYTNYNIKPVQQGFGGGGGNWDKQRKGFAYLGACTLLAAGKITKEQMDATIAMALEKYLS